MQSDCWRHWARAAPVGRGQSGEEESEESKRESEGVWVGEITYECLCMRTALLDVNSTERRWAKCQLEQSAKIPEEGTSDLSGHFLSWNREVDTSYKLETLRRLPS